VVSTSASIFPPTPLATPLRRMRFVFHVLNQLNSRPPGWRAPKVPLGGGSKLMTSPSSGVSRRIAMPKTEWAFQQALRKVAETFTEVPDGRDIAQALRMLAHMLDSTAER
jgi:hypothetical protein